MYMHHRVTESTERAQSKDRSQSIQSALNLLKANTSRISEGKAVEVGDIIWMGHTALDIDDWEIRDT